MMRAVAAMMVFVLCGLSLQPALADPLFGRRGGGARLDAPYLPPPRREMRELDQRGMSPGEAAQRAQQINGGGRVLSVERAGDGYRVKLLRDGEVRVVFVR